MTAQGQVSHTAFKQMDVSPYLQNTRTNPSAKFGLRVTGIEQLTTPTLPAKLFAKTPEQIAEETYLQSKACNSRMMWYPEPKKNKKSLSYTLSTILRKNILL
jgi:hypothetical protein